MDQIQNDNVTQAPLRRYVNPANNAGMIRNCPLRVRPSLLNQTRLANAATTAA